MHDTSSAIRSRLSLERLRFLGYIGVQFNAILTPLLIYHMTGSAAAAGLGLIIEWAPKLALYLSAGALIARFGGARIHLSLDLARLAALALTLMASLGLLGWVAVAIGAGLFQCSNALSNVLFETSVTRWWAPPDRHLGHARLMLRDQLGSLLALGCALLIPHPRALAALALAGQSIAFALVWRERHRLHPSSAPRAPSARLRSHLIHDLRAALSPRFRLFALAGLCLSTAPALVFSSLALFLGRALGRDPSEALALALLASAASGAAALSWLASGSGSRLPGDRLALAGSLGSAGVCLALASAGSALAVGALALTLSGVSKLHQPWMRDSRQRALSSLEEARRGGVTGAMISIEALSYLLAGALLAAFSARLDLALSAAAALSLAGALLARRAVASLDTSP